MHDTSKRFARPMSLLTGALIAVASTPSLADVTISTDATVNMACAGGVCSPTATDAVLNVNDLENLLASGNVEVTTTGSGVQANNIDVVTATSWSTSNALTLDAYQSITIDSAVSIAGLSGLTLTTNDGGTGGLLSFGSGGDVTFANLSSILTIDGSSYFLVDGIDSLASAIATNPSGEYALADSFGAAKAYSTDPIETTFTGILEGLGNSISRFKINDRGDNNLGFFREIGAGGQVRDFALRNARVVTGGTGQSTNVGILAGSNSGIIAGCSSTGTVTDTARNGAALGGLVGENNITGTISGSYSSAAVTGPDVLGGLAGGNAGVVEDSFATGRVSGSHVSSIGGLIGSIGGTASVLISYATGDVTAGNGAEAGGLVGYADEQPKISNSYATGSVSVGSGHGRFDAIAGGLVGLSVGLALSDSYSIGSASGAGGQPTCGGRGEKTCVGGSIGWNAGSEADIYWDTTASGNTNAVGYGGATGITGLTSAQIKSGLPPGFDPAIWGQQKGVNHGFPYLLAIPPK